MSKKNLQFNCYFKFERKKNKHQLTFISLQFSNKTTIKRTVWIYLIHHCIEIRLEVLVWAAIDESVIIRCVVTQEILCAIQTDVHKFLKLFADSFDPCVWHNHMFVQFCNVNHKIHLVNTMFIRLKCDLWLPNALDYNQQSLCLRLRHLQYAVSNVLGNCLRSNTWYNHMRFFLYHTLDT